MGPKKGGKEEVIDLASLPPWISVNCILKYEGDAKRGKEFQDKLKSFPFSFQKFILKDDIINFSKEKGLYVDPTSDPKKASKKDSKGGPEIATEITPELLSNALNLLYQDIIVQARKEKKEKQDLLDAPPPDPKKTEPPKKDKKGGKVEEPKEEHVESIKTIEKDYKKACDMIYFFTDFPDSGEELQALGQNKFQIDLILYVKQKLVLGQGEHDMSLLEQNQDNFEEEYAKRMEDFINNGGNEEVFEEEFRKEQDEKIAEKKQKLLEYSEEENQEIQKKQQFLQDFKNVRRLSEKTSAIRQIVLKELVYEVDVINEQNPDEETEKAFFDALIEELCQFSFDIQQFQEWLSTKKCQPLSKVEAEAQRILYEQEERKRQEEQAALELQQQQQEQQGKGKKEAKKDNKGKEDEEKKRQEEAEKLRQEQEEKLRFLQEEEIRLEKEKKFVKEPLFTYNKQLSTLSLEKTSSGILLDSLVEQILSENDETQKYNPKYLEEQENVTNLLDNLETFIQFRVLNTVNNQQSKQTQKIIIDEADRIMKVLQDQKLFNNEDACDKEKQILGKLKMPGIDRQGMPDFPTKSEDIRKAEKCSQYPFISCQVQEFERRMVLNKFEQMLIECEPEREWNLEDRIYLERHNKNTITQTLYKALLFDPIIITQYDVRNDSLFIALYYKNPPGRVMRQKWSCEWRVIPNLESWINFFKNSENNIKNDVFYEFDYQDVGNIHERVKLMYPTDNSVIMATKYHIGGQDYYNYKVIKDGLQFGIRNNPRGMIQFWCNFDNNYTRFLAEINNSENKKVSLSLTQQNGLIVKFLPNSDVYQQIIKTKSRNQNKEFEDTINPNLEDLQSMFESSRVITGKGTLIKYMKDGSTWIYYPNGNTSFCKSASSPWITTNNKGFRKLRSKTDRVEQELDQIPCAKRTDPQMGSIIIIRSDQTLIVINKDGSRYVKFQDGTEFSINSDSSLITIEHVDYATVEVVFDFVKMRTDSTIGIGAAPSMGFDNLFERSNDGRILKTYLADGTIVKTYKEKRELNTGYQEYEKYVISLVFFQDDSVAKFSDTGELIFISSQDRFNLNQQGENALEGNDKDYWIQLYSVPEERKAGVFTCDLQEQQLWTRDDQGNYFCLKANGEIDLKIAVSLNLEQAQQNQEYERPGTPEIQDGDFIEEENKFLPQPEKWIPPRLFVIYNDNSAQEIMNEEQFQYYLRNQQNNKNCIQLNDEGLPGYEKCESLSFITFNKSLAEQKQKFITPVLPKNLDIIPQTRNKREVDKNEVCLFRNILKFTQFNAEIKEQFKNDFGKWQNWQKEQLRQQQEFGIMQRDQDLKTQEFEIQLQILENRTKNYKQQSYDEWKDKINKLFEENREIFLDLLKENTSFQELDDSQIKSKIQQSQIQFLKPKKSLIFSIEILPNLQQQRMSSIAQIQDTFKDIPEKKKTKKYPPISKSDEKWHESIKGTSKGGYFVKNYFQTNDGAQALNELITTKQLDLVSQAAYLQKIALNKKDKQDRIIQQQNLIESEKKVSLSTQQRNSQDIQNQIPNQPQDTQQVKQQTIYLQPSVFAKRDYEESQRQFKEEQNALQKRQSKTKNYNIYGQARNENQQQKVPCLLKTQPRSELNEKYILQDSLTDNRLKISSMHNRVYLKAPSINELRNTGSHTALQKTLDKKNSLDKIEANKNLMITADLTDQLRKNISINPVSARFGVLKIGQIYEMNIIVKNEDVLAQRLALKQPSTKFAKVFMRQMGLISLGLQRQIGVRLEASAEIMGRFQDQFQIVSKHDIFTIPIQANIMDNEEFERLDHETRETTQKSVLKPYVSQLKFQNQHNSFPMDSNTSDMLPKLNNYDKNYKLDPYVSFGKNKKKNEDDSFEQSYPK